VRRAILPLAVVVAALVATACGQRVPSGGPDAGPGSSSPMATASPSPSPLPSPTAYPSPDTAPTASADPFRGLGAWVDIFDRTAFGDPEGTVATLEARGVRTLYLETQSYRFRGDFRFPEPLGRFLDAAHEAGIKVVAWYVPGFDDLARDLDRSLAAIDFASPTGQRFDGFGLDIEVTVVADPAERAERVVELSSDIRMLADQGYPLGAIVPSPLRSSSYWPILPMAELGAIYDAMLPMAYWTGHASGEGGAHDYISESIQIVRDETGRPGIPIHVIGGLAGESGAEEIDGFVRAVKEGKVRGASLYDAASTDEAGWAALGPLR